ncbi:diguanylate cyclase domain-containing protein [Polymorphum gilvum]|uniref:Cyclic diguanylate phosphodiesterase domain protein n=1 Tax=Polymorphum gilvum (strain LMG 25793 / CGMCC 1.9160 / SL003B-26A1) TaxID=991905 RepID=F2J0J8_POLGS|nr:diguanylate cyclase [Polymorphum gilvum]ADZ69666.1 Cyclic diguanylate phosphodiesterase domain protein [Polymorphum gilvum SL003B-26A1]
MHRETRLAKPEAMEPLDLGGPRSRISLRHLAYLAVAVLLAGGVFAMTWLLLTTTRSADRLALHHEQALVREALKHELALLARDQTFLSVSDRTVEAVRAARLAPAEASDIARRMWLDYDHDWTLLLDAGDAPLLVAAEDEVVPPAAADPVLAVARDLVDRARAGYAAVRRPAAEGYRVRYVDKGELAPIYATDVRAVSGIPALVGAMAVVPDTDAVTLPDGPPGVVVSVRLIEPRLLAGIADTFLLDGFRYTADAAPSSAHVPVAIDGAPPIGAFAWTSAAPGSAIRVAVGPLAAGLMIAFLALGWAAARKLAERSRALEESERRNRHMALHDSLTGLGNRVYFGEKLDAALAACHARPCAVLAIDLDRFKAVNDSFGHDAGDMVIRTVARRLQQALSGSGLVARTGGDEFLALVTETVEESHIRWLCDTIIEEATKPIPVGGGIARIGASIGWALAPRNGDTASMVLRMADQSLYRAKEAGRNMAVFIEDLYREQAGTRNAEPVLRPPASGRRSA